MTVDTVVGLIGGFVLSMITFLIGLKITKNKERRERLRKHIRKFFPLLSELAVDLSYTISTQMRSKTNDPPSRNLLEKIVKKLNSFEKAYSELRGAGLEPELESSDKKMSVEIKGLFTTWKIDGHKNLANKLNVYYSKAIVSRNLVESYLKK